MKFSKTILSTLILASSASFASTYNAEVGLEYTDFDGDTSSIQLNGVYHFTAVDTTNKPLAEAAFLQKHSFINARHTEYDFDEGGSTDDQAIGFGFYIPNSIFYVGAEYQKYEDWNDTLVTLGITPIEGLLLTTQHNEEADDYEANIQAKYVRQLAGDTAFNLEASFAKAPDSDEDDTFGFAGDYYFTSFFSVGASYVNQSIFSDEATTSVRTRYFFNDQFSLNAEIGSNEDVDTFSFGAALRF